MAHPEGALVWLLGGLHVDAGTLVVSLGALVLSIYARSLVGHRKRLPPGPRGLPFFGVLPLMGKKPYVTLQGWWRKYGDVYSAYMGSRLVIVLNGVEVFKECFVKQGDNFTGRPWMFFKKMTKNTGLMFTDGEVWREHRRFALQCLRDFGMGKVSMERKVNEEATFVLRELEVRCPGPVDISAVITQAVSNIILSTVFGNRFEYDDAIFRANLEALEQSAKRHTVLGMVNFMPSLEGLLKLLPQDPLLQRNIRMRDDFAADKMREHKRTLDCDNPRDLIDAYFARMKRFKDTNTHTTFEDAQLKRTIQDLFITGTETMSTTMSWAFLFMACHPEVQARVQAEIEHVIGRGRQPSMTDRPHMPYTEATIMECQRLGNISMFSVPRCTFEDTSVNGYEIPAGTWVLTNRWGMHSANKYWPKPSVFDPTRFLRDGKVHKPDAFVPFGMGPRSCIGEVFAKMELFLFFTGVLQQFELRLPEGAPTPSLEPVLGINMTPKPYKLVITHR